MARGKIVRMEDWDAPAYRPKLMSESIPRCDFTPRAAMHRIGDMYYLSTFRRSKEGMPFKEIKVSAECAGTLATEAERFLWAFVGNLSGWCIVTTPQRRHFGGFHLATEVCRDLSARLGIPFHEGAVQTLNKDRIHPDFCLLRPIEERNVIIYDDIITTGSTMLATSALFADRDFVINLIGISNR